MTPDGSTVPAPYLNGYNRGNKEVKLTHSTHTKQIMHKNVPEVLDPQKPQEHTRTDGARCHRGLTQTHCPSGTLTCPQTLMVKLVYLQTTSPQPPAGFLCLFVLFFFNKER